MGSSFDGQLLPFCQLLAAFFLLITLAETAPQTDERHADWKTMAKSMLERNLKRPLNTNVARNIIFFLGDGMGVATVTAARIYAGQQRGLRYGEESSLTFERFSHVGLAKTYNVDFQVPDSAGTATAFLGGVKTNCGVIGVNQKVRRSNCSDVTSETLVSSILRWSLDDGKRAGVVTTSDITDATAAASYAHSADRYWESDADVPIRYRQSPFCRDIASQLVDNNSDINVMLGGGRKYFQPRDASRPADRGKRQDGRNLIKEWIRKLQDRRASYASDKQTFDDVDADTTDFLLGIFNDDSMTYRLDDSTGEPTLPDMTEKAIRILRRANNGYFLLVEGGRIDHGHHDGSAKYALEEVIAFNEAVERAVLLTSTSDTLIVVTADHSHVMTMGGYPSRGNPILSIVDDIGYRQAPARDEMPYLTLNYANGPGILGRTDLTGVNTGSKTFKQPVNVPLDSETHGGEDVAVYANGPMSHLFTGVNEQHYLAHAMAYASCVGDAAVHKADCIQRLQLVTGSSHHVASSSFVPWMMIVLVLATVHHCR